MTDITVSTTILGFGSIPTTNATSVTYNGVTFNFDTSMPVGYFFDGEPFVVSTSAFNITSTSPASAVVDTWQAYGMMKNPLFGLSVDLAGGQGFDAIMDTDNAPGSSRYTYSAAKNIDPGYTASSVAVAQGEECSFVKAIRKSGATDSAWQVFEKYVTLTVLASAPAPGTVMPSPSATTKTLYNVADIDLTTTRSITMPASFLSASATATAQLAKVPTYLAHWGVGGEIHRRFRLDESLNGASNNYSAYLVHHYAYLLLHLHNSATTKPEKYQIAARILRHAAQVEAIYDTYGAFEYNKTNKDEGLDFDAGQGGGVHMWIWAAAFLLKNGSLKTKAEAIKSQLVSPFWLANSDVGKTPSTRSTESPQPTFPEQVGFPEQFPEGHTTDILGPYKNLGATNAYWEAISLLPLYNFGGDWTYSLTGGTHDTTNQKAAVIAFLDRVRTWGTTHFPTSNVPAVWHDLYDTLRSYSTMSQWAGQPEQFPLTSGHFTAGDGQIAWDTLSYDFATETVTQRDFRYSLDGIQWIVDSDVATTGTKTGLLKGAPHLCGLRQHSASGTGAWSLNFPLYDFVDMAETTELSGTTPTLVAGGMYWTLTGNSAPVDGMVKDNRATLWINNPNNYTITWPGNYSGTQPTLRSGVNLVRFTRGTTNLTAGLERGLVVTTGTDSAAAPVNTVAPKIFMRDYEYWVYPLWEEAPATLSASDSLYLAAGSGYWTGYPAPAITYQWKRDGSPISGATSQQYQRVQADAETVLTCEVTATNASGSASITTSGVTTPALATIPAGTLIDSNMDSSFMIDYETEWVNIRAWNCEAKVITSLQPDENLNRGGLKLHNKNGNIPSVVFELTRNLTAGSTYRVQAQLWKGEVEAGQGLIFDVLYTQAEYETANVGLGKSYFDKGVNRFRNGSSGYKSLLQDALMSDAGTTTFNETNWSGTVTVTGGIMDIDITFGVDAGETLLNPSIYFGNPTSTGSSSYGNQVLHYCKLSEVV